MNMLRTIKSFLPVFLGLLLVFTGSIVFLPSAGEHTYLHCSAGPE